MRFVALLRGINVGGANVVRMADLKHAVEGAGFSDVASVIASGNVIVEAPPGSHQGKLEAALSTAFWTAWHHDVACSDVGRALGGLVTSFHVLGAPSHANAAASVACH